MPHRVHAATTLIRQVDEHRGKVTVWDGEPDGFNKIRDITFDAKTSKWLKPILEACDDSRIRDLTVGEKSRLTVSFIGTMIADDGADFALDEADSVLNADDDGDGGVNGDPLVES